MCSKMLIPVISASRKGKNIYISSLLIVVSLAHKALSIWRAAHGDPANSRRYMAPTSIIVPLSAGNTYRAADAVQNPLTPRLARLFHQCDSKK